MESLKKQHPEFFNPETLEFFGRQIGKKLIKERYFVSASRPSREEEYKFTIHLVRQSEIFTLYRYGQFFSNKQAEAEIEKLPDGFAEALDLSIDLPAEFLLRKEENPIAFIIKNFRRIDLFHVERLLNPKK